MMAVMKTDLPASFRITGTRSQANALLQIIESKYFSELTRAKESGGEVVVLPGQTGRPAQRDEEGYQEAGDLLPAPQLLSGRDGVRCHLKAGDSFDAPALGSQRRASPQGVGHVRGAWQQNPPTDRGVAQWTS